jgi:hypothetical protein
MAYVITPAVRAAARRCGVIVRPSTVHGKKLDVYVDGVRIRSIGDASMPDFHTYLRTHGRAVAERRRDSYWARHQRDAHRRLAPDGHLSAGWLAARILWPR